MKLSVYSIITKNYISHIKTCLDSLKDHHTQVDAHVLIIDSFLGYINPDDYDFKIYSLSDVGISISETESLLNRYTPFQICCALKPLFGKFILENINTQCFYIDADLYFLNSINESIVKLAESNILLTPHLINREIVISEQEALHEAQVNATGFFNMGFFGLRKSSETFKFLDWWYSRSRLNCQRDLANGFFDDQKHIDAVPFLFNNVTVFTNPGYNVAFWNLNERIISKKDTSFVVNNKHPLVFFHFSRYQPQQPYKLTQHLTIQSDHTPSLEYLTNTYKQKLVTNQWPQTHLWPFSIFIEQRIN